MNIDANNAVKENEKLKDQIDQIAKALNVGNMFATMDTLQEAVDFGADCDNSTVAMCILMNTISAKLTEITTA